MSKLLDAMRFADHWWLALHGLIVDVDYALSAPIPRKPLTMNGTLKVKPTLIPGADYSLNRVLKKYGGWSSVMTASFEPSELFYEELRAIGYDRERFDRSRAYVIDPVGYQQRVLRELDRKKKT